MQNMSLEPSTSLAMCHFMAHTGENLSVVCM